MICRLSIGLIVHKLGRLFQLEANAPHMIGNSLIPFFQIVTPKCYLVQPSSGRYSSVTSLLLVEAAAAAVLVNQASSK